MSVVANVAINVDSRNAVNQLRQVETRAAATEKAFGALQQAAAAFGAGFALTKVIADVKELDTNLRRLGTVGGDVQALDKGLGALSKQLDGVASKAELAAASYQALSAGFTETGANLKVVEAATKAAVGGLVDVTSVVEVTTKTLNAYGLSGEYAIKVTDSISKAIEFGQVQWSDYTSQLGRVAATAALAGVSIDEINAFVAAATKNGATAEVAFTGLSAALATLLKPTKESTEAAAALGIEWNVGGLQAKGFTGLLEDLSKKQDANKTAVAALLGSQEALRGVLAANSKTGKDYQMILEGLGGAAGKTEKDFQTMKGSLENQLKALDTAFKNLSEALGVAFGPTVISAIQDVAGVVNAFAQIIKSIPQPVADLLGGLLKLAAAVGVLSAAINLLNGTTALVTAALIPMRAAIVASTTASVANTAATTANASAFALYANNARTVAAATTAATGATVGLRAAVLALLNPWGLLAAGIIAATVALASYRSEAQKVAGAAKTGTAADVVAARNLSIQKGQEISLLESQRQNASGQQRASIDRRLRTLRGERAELQSAIAASTADRPSATGGLPNPAIVDQMPFDSGGGEKEKTKKDKAAEEEARLQARLRGIQIETNAIQKQSDVQQRILQAQIDGDDQRVIRLQGVEREQQILANLQGNLVGITDQRERQAVLAKAASELDAAQAQTAGELSRLDAQRTKAIEDAMRPLEEQRQVLEATLQGKGEEVRLQLEIERILRSTPELERNKVEELVRGNAQLEKQIQGAQELRDLYQNIANTIASSLGSAIDAAVSGTENLGDALKKLGRDLLATIGKMLIMYAIGQALGAISGGKGALGFLAKGFGFKGAKDGAYWSGGFEAFADGGVVTSPTMGLIGEGGEPEYVIPASKMRTAMARYSAGARGSSVIPGAATDGGDSMGTGNQSAPGVIDVRYTVERINNVDYVTADQFQAGMKQAAMQGAKQGEQRTLARLQNAPSARRRIGI